MNGSQGRPELGGNAWKATAWILAVLLALSMSENAVVLWRVSARATGVSTTTASAGGYGSLAAAPCPTRYGRQVAAAPAPVVDVSADGGPAIGSRGAKVQVIAFLDYECPFCRQWYEESFGQMENEYISTGKIRFVTRDYPLAIHPHARAAAVAANCVRTLADDNMYYRYQNILLEGGDLAQATLEGQAVQLAIDKQAFEHCIADAKRSITKKIDKDVADGAAAGVTGTPTFFVNGRMMVGAQAYAVFKATIDAELKRTGATR